MIVRCLEMKAICDHNDIFIQNIEKEPEKPVFKLIADAFQTDRNIEITNVINGPTENIVIAKCNNDEVSLIYDIDFGIMPIQCTTKNLDAIFSLVNKVLT